MFISIRILLKWKEYGGQTELKSCMQCSSYRLLRCNAQSRKFLDHLLLFERNTVEKLGSAAHLDEAQSKQFEIIWLDFTKNGNGVCAGNGQF